MTLARPRSTSRRWPCRRLSAGLLMSACLCAGTWAQPGVESSNGASAAWWPVRPEVDRAYVRLLGSPAVADLLAAVKADHARATDDLRLLTEIEAPPFKEQARAEAFLARMKAVGLSDAYIDGEGNVIGLRKGAGNSRGRGPKLLVSAHLDTVFPAGTDVKVKEHDGRLYAPGISDDTRGLAVLLSWIKVLNDSKIGTVGDLLFVGSVGEEELGNLRGMKRLFAEHRDIDGMVGLEPAGDGMVIVSGTASRRHQVTFEGPGGHSYADFGKVPSAIHGMGRAVAKIADIRPAGFPRTTFTVGTVSGGSSVNTIAAQARMAVDIRSDGMPALARTERRILNAVDAAVAEENRRWGVSTLVASVRLIGDRPGGRTPSDTPIVEAAMRANTAFGLRTTLVGASTDANVAMSLGVPAIVVGSGGETGGFHSLGEWIDLTDAWQGAQRSLLTVLALAGVESVSSPLLPKRPPRGP